MKVLVWAQRVDRTADRPVPRRRKAIPSGLLLPMSIVLSKLFEPVGAQSFFFPMFRGQIFCHWKNEGHRSSPRKPMTSSCGRSFEARMFGCL